MKEQTAIQALFHSAMQPCHPESGMYWPTSSARGIEAVRNLYNEIGIDKLAQQKIEYYFAQSRKFLNEVGVSDERKKELAAYAERMMHRQY